MHKCHGRSKIICIMHLDFLWDNFNKTHGSNSFIYGDPHTHSVEVSNRAALALFRPKSCLNKTCQIQCEHSCNWKKERIPNEINFDEICLNKHETNVKSNFKESRSKFFLREKLRTYLHYSLNLKMSIIQEKAYLLKPHLQMKA